MQKVKISDITLRENSIKKGTNLGFKEKIEIAKKLDKLNIDVIEIAKIENKKTESSDSVLIFYFTSLGLLDRKSQVTLNSFQFTQQGCGQPAHAPVQSFC